MPQLKIIISGTVQGVGFRPFIYRIAKKNNIRGYIRNSGNIIELLIKGNESKIINFLNEVKNNHPPLARIADIEIKSCNEKPNHDFLILKSDKYGSSDSATPPDIAICNSCLNEMFDKKNRRYLYPFTACTDCGPRFTIIESLPYDRENTTMSGFEMCETCRKEYLDAMDRRFRAEPVCCHDCGPSYELYMGKENTSSKTPIRDAADALDNGKIVAIKGIGGTHFVAGTADDNAIMQMRKILRRPQKPFAIMVRNLDEAHRIAFISEKEMLLLLSPQRPIVLLKKKNRLSENISPGLGNTGIMLPYSGMHHLLFHYSRQHAFVMTSANQPGEPMAIDNDEVLSLGAELSLIHNRAIKNRCDDSVVKVVDNKISFIRHSRGFVTSQVEVNDTKKIVLSLGSELDVTACILKKDRAFLTQYIGNTTKLRTIEYLEAAIDNLMELTGIEKVDTVAVDMHPSFNTSILGNELSKKFEVPLIKCQHHFAHAASLEAESGAQKMVCIAADGMGYGNDGTVWGGEIITVDDGFERAGNLLPQLMPGGDLAARYPARMAMGILSNEFDQSELSEMFAPFFAKEELSIVLRQVERKFNSPLTSSTGRVLDSIAVLLDVCRERTYEGEPAMKLEAFAEKGKNSVEIPVMIKKIEGRYVLDTTEIVKSVYLAKEKHSPYDIAASAQTAIAKGLCEMAVREAKDKDLKVIGFSGGVAYNDVIVRTARAIAEEEGFEFITHEKVPCGDGGLSLGQAVIGARAIAKKSIKML